MLDYDPIAWLISEKGVAAVRARRVGRGVGMILWMGREDKG